MSHSTSTELDRTQTTKWEALYALRERIVLFVAMLERRNRLYPLPFHRCMHGGRRCENLDALTVRYSDTVSTVAAGETILGVFFEKTEINNQSTLPRLEQFQFNEFHLHQF
jgi:hypothetical protein